MLEGLKQKPENTRRNIAFTASLLISLLIFSGWFYSKGYFGYSTTTIIRPTEETAPVAAKSPLGNTNSVFDQISREYQALKDSLASVIVPFITGIDVYNKGDSK